MTVTDHIPDHNTPAGRVELTMRGWDCEDARTHAEPMKCRVISTRGAQYVADFCSHCFALLSDWIKHSELPDPIDSYPVARNNATEYSKHGLPCEVCGETYLTELHHWAPKHLFGDAAWDWPTSRLCPQHHHEWHRRVTPIMKKPKS